MREIRPSSLEGGVTLTTPSLPLSSTSDPELVEWLQCSGFRVFGRGVGLLNKRLIRLLQRCAPAPVRTISTGHWAWLTISRVTLPSMYARSGSTAGDEPATT